MAFKSGECGNRKGRPKGTCGGRMLALAGLDQLLARKKNKEKLIAALEDDLNKNALHFFKTVVMPLLPKESKMAVEHDGVIEWKSLLGDEPGETPRFDADGKPIPGVS